MDTGRLNKSSSQCIGTSTWTYPTVPQNVIDPWSMAGPCMSLSCICHDPLYSTGCRSKAFDVSWAVWVVSQLPPLGDPFWEEIEIAAYSAATTPDVSANATD
jgi:hypothetical protein